MPNQMRKSLSLPISQISDGDESDPRNPLVRQDIAALGVRWVKIFVNWNAFDSALGQATTTEEFFDAAQTGTTGQQLRRIDKIIRALNDLGRDLERSGGGMGVILGLFQSYPQYANGATTPEPGTNAGPRQRVPLNCTTVGTSTNRPYFLWLLGVLFARYRIHEGQRLVANTAPSSTTSIFGNPSAAWVNAVEIVNEPNDVLWPQNVMPFRVAEMIETATMLSAAFGWPPVFAPSITDRTRPAASAESTPGLQFTQNLLGALEKRGFRPPSNVYLGFASHNYGDVADSRAVGSAGRLSAIRKALIDGRWKGGGEYGIWLTEGGYVLRDLDESVEERMQDLTCGNNFRATREVPDVVIWSNYQLNEAAGSSFRSALRRTFNGSTQTPGPPRPFYSTFRSLPAPNSVI